MKKNVLFNSFLIIFPPFLIFSCFCGTDIGIPIIDTGNKDVFVIDIPIISDTEVDTTPPETSIKSYPPDPSISSDATFEFECIGSNCTFECRLNARGWTSCVSPHTYSNLFDGLHKFEVRAKDAYENIDPTPAVYIWNVDTTPPDTIITKAPLKFTNITSASFEFGCNESKCFFRCKMDDGGWVSCSSPMIYNNLSEGSHTFEVKAMDQVGYFDSTPAAYTWTIDVIPPETTITSYPSNPSHSSFVTFEFICNETDCMFECRLDLKGWSLCTSPKTYSGLVDGSHTFEVRAIDQAGNIDQSPESYEWTSQCVSDCWISDRPDAFGWHTSVWTGREMIVWSDGRGWIYDPVSDSWMATSTTNAPSSRYRHTAVWTGSEMIIWGGGGGKSTGGRYNPITDSWKETSVVNAPSERYGHTAIWTGTEMIIWGGCLYSTDGYEYFDTGGRYNPVTDSWKAISTENVPTARSYHTAVWTGTEMIIWGGEGSYRYFSNGGRYNPVTDSWTTVEGIYGGRKKHTAVWTGSEMIVWGGYYYSGSEHNFFDTGYHYNPITDTWVLMGNVGAPIARADHTAVWTGSEMIVWGGFGSSGYLSTGGRYNPITNNWVATSITSVPSSRYGHTAIWTGSEMIVWGGFGGGNTGGRYNPVTDNWIPTNISNKNAPFRRYGHTAIWTGSEMIVWGGTDGSTYWRTGGRYNPVTDSWMATSTTDAPRERERHTAVWTGNEMIVWGGTDGSTYRRTGGRYNPVTDSWMATSTIDAPSRRDRHIAVWTGSEMIVWGGYFYFDDYDYGSFNVGGRYNPVTDIWTAISTTNAPSARGYYTGVWTGSEMIIWGGYGEEKTGGRYNPVTDIWTAISTTDAPSEREYHTAVWTGSEMIIWGGMDEYRYYLNTGRRYNPVTDTWVPTSIINAPLGRLGHTAVWTGSEMIIWGGYNFSYGELNSGGRYNPSSDLWTEMSTINAPLGRLGHIAVWTGSEMIVWGGYDGERSLNTGGRYKP